MEEYNKLMTKIKTYFEMEDIENTEDIISAYDLIQILTEKFQVLYDVIYSNTLKERINEVLLTEKKVGKIFKKIIKIQKRKVEYLLTHFEKGKATLSINILEDRFDGRYGYHTWICKDLDSDQLYYTYRSPENENVVNEFLSDIERNLYIIEEFYKLIRLTDPSINKVPDYDAKFSQVFSDGFLKIAVTYDTYGKVKYQFSIDEQEDPNELFKREWLNLECIKDYVNNNAESLLKKIPVNVSELNETSKEIIREYNKKKENIKRLELTDNN